LERIGIHFITAYQLLLMLLLLPLIEELLQCFT